MKPSLNIKKNLGLRSRWTDGARGATGVAVTLAAAVFLCGCGESGNDDASAATDAGSGAQETPANNQATTPTEPEIVFTTATPDGTLNLFAKALSEGNFFEATEYCDPTSDNFEQLSELAGGIEQGKARIAELKASENPEEVQSGKQLEMLLPIMSSALTMAYAKYSIEEVAVQEPDARYNLSLANGNTISVDLTLQGETWTISDSSESLVQVDQAAIPEEQRRAAEQAQPAGPPAPGS